MVVLICGNVCVSVLQEIKVVKYFMQNSVFKLLFTEPFGAASNTCLHKMSLSVSHHKRK